MPRKSRAPAGIDEQLRAAIIASEATHYRLATNAGINPEIVGRFKRSPARRVYLDRSSLGSCAASAG